MAVINSPFESKYGFKGPGFTVDEEGNIIANSIITATTPGDDNDVTIVDFTVTVDTQTNSFSIAEAAGTNPSISVARQSVYTFALDVPVLNFFIVSGNQIDSDLYNTGISHSDGSTGSDAQGKNDGTLRFSIPLNAPDTLYYTDTNRTNFGVINVVDPIGRFGTISVTDVLNSTSPTTGSVTLAGGLGIEKDLYIGGSLNVGGTGITSLASSNNLELEAVNEISLRIEGQEISKIGSTGLSGTIIDSTINNSTIGAITPAAASFSTAKVTATPTADEDITNKQYTDSTALALSIAFGL